MSPGRTALSLYVSLPRGGDMRLTLPTSRRCLLVRSRGGLCGHATDAGCHCSHNLSQDELPYIKIPLCVARAIVNAHQVLTEHVGYSHTVIKLTPKAYVLLPALRDILAHAAMVQLRV